MNRPVFSSHAQSLLTEREIPESWVWRALENFDRRYLGPDENYHYLKKIIENEGRVLRVVVNEQIDPPRIVTLFFDRRLRGKL